jgi:hypothetical protein
VGAGKRGGFDHGQLAVFVWRADRAGGDTKTPKSRRTLALPRRCTETLREQQVRQRQDRLAAGPMWQDHDLVFASTAGTPLDDHNVRRQFRAITETAGLGSVWVPRELRHTFVSLLSAHGVPVVSVAMRKSPCVARSKWLWPNCRDRGQSASRTRLRSRSGFARPYICRLIILMRLTWPSTAPEL